jgi:cell division protein FtsB
VANGPIAGSEEHAKQVLKATRRVLVIVSIFAASAIGIAIWLYSTTIPKIRQQQAQISEQKAQLMQQQIRLSSTSEKLAKFCYDLATRENVDEHKPDDSITTLDECALIFPHDETFAAYKALVLASRFIQGQHKMTDLDDALQAASQSLAIKPNILAYDWKGFTYCLKVKFGQSTEQSTTVQSAIQTFQAEFTHFPRKDTLKDTEEFREYCPSEVQRALYP